MLPQSEKIVSTRRATSEPDWRYMKRTRYPKVFAKGKPSQQLHVSMNPNKALWEKGDFTRIAETMRESGEALVSVSESQRDQGSGSRVRRWDDGIAGSETRSRRPGSRYRAQPGGGGKSAREGTGPDELYVSGRRCVQSAANCRIRRLISW